MRVCQVTGEYPPMRGGVADYTAFLVAALARNGVSSVVITSEKALALRPEGVRGNPLPEVYGVPGWGYSSLGRIGEVVEGTRPDVVHIQYQTGAFGMHPAINLLPLWLRLRSHRPKVVVTFHDLRVPYLFPKAGPVRHLASSLLLAGADAVVATNAEDAAALSFGARSGSGAVERAGRFGPPLHRVPIGSNIPVNPVFGFEREQWRARLGVGSDQLLLCYFGFLAHSKGVDLLLGALGELARRGRNVKLVMIGGSAGDTNVSDRPYERQIRVQADEPTFRSRVLWTGFTGTEEVSANLLASDLCVLPFREGASLRHGTLIAAIAHGLPIVTTVPSPVPPLGESVRLVAGENCCLAPRNSLEGLVSAIEEVAGSPAVRERLSAGAKGLADHFRWDTIARRTLRLYQGLTGLEENRSPAV